MDRSAVFYAYGFDCLQTQREAAVASDDRAILEDLVGGLLKIPSLVKRGFTAHDVVEEVGFEAYQQNDENNGLRQLLRSLPKDKSQTIATALGYLLRSSKNININGYRMVQPMNANGNRRPGRESCLEDRGSGPKCRGSGITSHIQLVGWCDWWDLASLQLSSGRISARINNHYSPLDHR